MDKKAKTLKVILIGNSSVGKTCLIHHYDTGKFLDNIPPTVGSSFIKIKKKINEQNFILNFWDTAGQERHNSLTQTFAKNAQIAILVYAINDRESFKDLGKWLKIVKDNNGEKGYVLGVAGNKSDLYQEETVKENEGKKYAKKIGALFKVTSAKESCGIKEFVDELILKFMEIPQEEESPHKSSISSLDGQDNVNDITGLNIKVDNDKKKNGCC